MFSDADFYRAVSHARRKPNGLDVNMIREHPK